uniref:Uncharacterized protein AlNc14C155G7628 n=2 Tax=Albugo laibachii Nc14 TaxID=890382 RepID=F0WMC9_9STRA|nr:conserved hypothetical protein [Albugo laibachii Nc14]|eukprot:CCA22460.1 conserved hypothetical protein [Albugo laibachii Nc14]
MIRIAVRLTACFYHGTTYMTDKKAINLQGWQELFYNVGLIHVGLRSVEDVATFSEVHPENVEQMNLHGNHLKNLNGIEQYQRISELCASNNCIESIDSLRTLRYLRILDLSANNISSLEHLSIIPTLEELALAHNHIEDIRGFINPIKFPNLVHLDLRNNAIQAYGDLQALTQYRNLSHLRLQENPICDDPEYPLPILATSRSLQLIDQEECEVFKEMENLHMPRYSTILREYRQRWSECKQNAEVNDKSSRPKSAEIVRPHSNSKQVFTKRAKQKSIFLAQSLPEVQPETKPQIIAKDVEKVKLSELAKTDVATNTEADYERELVKMKKQVFELEREYSESEKASKDRQQQLLCQERIQQKRISQLESEVDRVNSSLQKAESVITPLRDEVQKLEIKLGEMSAEIQLQKQIETSITKDTDMKILMDELKCEAVNTLASVREEIAKVVKEFDSEQRQVGATEKTQGSCTTHCNELEACKMLLSRSQHEMARLEKRLEEFAAESRPNHVGEFSTAKDEELLNLRHRFDSLKQRFVHSKTLLAKKQTDTEHLVQLLEVRNQECDTLRRQNQDLLHMHENFAAQQMQVFESQLQTKLSIAESEFRKEFELWRDEREALTKRLESITSKYQVQTLALQRAEKKEARWRRKVAHIEKDKSLIATRKGLGDRETPSQFDKFEQEIEKITRELSTVQQERDQVKKSHELCGDLQAKVVSLENENNQLLSSAKQQHEQMESDWKRKQDEWEATIKIKDVMITAQTRQIDNIRQQSDEGEVQNNKERSYLLAQISELESTLDEHIQKLDNYRHRITDLKQERQELISRLQSAEELSTASRSKFLEAKKATEVLKSELETLRISSEKEKCTLQELLSEQKEITRRQLQEQSHRMQKVHDDWKIQEEDTRKKLSDDCMHLQRQLKKTTDRKEQLTAHLQAARTQLAQNDRDLRVLITQV